MMIDSDRKTAAQEVEEPEATDPSATDESRADGTIEELLAPAAQIERLEAEKADLTERLVRLAADMDNLRKRTERDVADARKYAVTKFAADMLVVGDNLKRALDAVPADRRESDEDLKALAEGVDMTAREMERMLQKNNIMPIPALGERFDPHLHQAMFEIPDPSVPAGTVVQVMQEGYQIGDRVLRAALVGVSKGGSAAPPSEPGGADSADSPE
jgi:molecular chaperone GrpE